jgi:hypothetical protein
MLQQAVVQDSHMSAVIMVTPLESVISRLLPVASPQLVRTTSLVNCPLSTLPDLEMLLVETRLVLSAVLPQQPPPRLHLLTLAAPSLQAHRSLAARMLKLRPRVVMFLALQRTWATTATLRPSLLLRPVRAVSRPQVSRVTVPRYQVLPAFFRALPLRHQIAHTLLECLAPLGRLRHQALIAPALLQSRLARALLLLLLRARALPLPRARALLLPRARAIALQLSPARVLVLLRSPLARALFHQLSPVRASIHLQPRLLKA